MTKVGPSPKKAEEVRRKKGIGKATKIKKLRLKLGLSQTELAAKTEIPLKTLQKYESGNRVIDGAKLDTICQISLALNCKITDILEDENLIEKFNSIV